MKKIYVRPVTEKITEAWAKCDVKEHASHIYNGAEDNFGGEYNGSGDGFEVGAKKFVWDDEDNPWNN